jgi:hypothetical protein
VIASRDRFDITKTGVQSLDRLEAYLEAKRFRGYDPYDALSPPDFSTGRPSLVELSNSSRARAQALGDQPPPVAPDSEGGTTLSRLRSSSRRPPVARESTRSTRMHSERGRPSGWRNSRDRGPAGTATIAGATPLIGIRGTWAFPPEPERSSRRGWMHCSDGHFAYKVRRRRVVRIPYIRWSSAYMCVALSRLAYALTNESADG